MPKANEAGARTSVGETRSMERRGKVANPKALDPSTDVSADSSSSPDEPASDADEGDDEEEEGSDEEGSSSSSTK